MARRPELTDADLAAFWEKDDRSHGANCFALDAPQVALGLRMSEECVFTELGEPGNPWGRTPSERMADLCRRYNDRAERIVGRCLLDERVPTDEERLPPVRNIGEVFGGRVEFNGISEWLTKSCDTPQELEAVLDRVDRLDLRGFVLPADWEREKRRVFEQYGRRPEPWRSVRGPVTLAMSIYGVENLIFLIADEPDLAKRFSDTILRVIRGYVDLFDAEAGFTRETRPHGFWFNDDDCCLLTPDMYEAFGFPVLSAVFADLCPDRDDLRYQHSDSPMAHLLPVLSRLDLTGVNFGPTLTVDEIRAHLPRACIDGQLAPFTLMRNDEDAIVAEVRRDCEAAKRCGRGVRINTAGSVNDGSRLTSMRAVMAAIREYGQY